MFVYSILHGIYPGLLSLRLYTTEAVFPNVRFSFSSFYIQPIFLADELPSQYRLGVFNLCWALTLREVNNNSSPSTSTNHNTASGSNQHTSPAPLGDRIWRSLWICPPLGAIFRSHAVIAQRTMFRDTEYRRHFRFGTAPNVSTFANDTASIERLIHSARRRATTAWPYFTALCVRLSVKNVLGTIRFNITPTLLTAIGRLAKGMSRVYVWLRTRSRNILNHTYLNGILFIISQPYKVVFHGHNVRAWTTKCGRKI